MSENRSNLIKDIFTSIKVAAAKQLNFIRRCFLRDIFTAVNNNDIALVKKLLQLGENPNHQDQEDKTPLHYAAIKGNVEIAQILLEAGADPNAKDPLDYTPLHFASQYGHPEIIQLFAEYNNNLLTKDEEKRSG